MPSPIRAEQASDIHAIETLTAAAFLNAEHTSHTEQFIVNALRRAGQLTLSLVAEDDAQIVGHVAISPVTLSDGSANWYGLGPISVSPERQGQGIGAALMREVLAQLQDLGAAGCVLLGDPAYYQRFGFAARPELQLPDVPPEYFQTLSFTGSFPQASVAYSKAFEATS